MIAFWLVLVIYFAVIFIHAAYRIGVEDGIEQERAMIAMREVMIETFQKYHGHDTPFLDMMLKRK